MSFLSFPNADPKKIGVLFVNLGSPTKPTLGAIAHYLHTFLSDPRVVELPRLLWLPVLNGIVIPLRSWRNLHKYRTVWIAPGAQKSPLHVHSSSFLEKMKPLLTVECTLAMRYGEPHLGTQLEALAQKRCGHILVLPLYPQYSASTTASAFDAIYKGLRRWRSPPLIHAFYMPHGQDAYAAFPDAHFYIDALAEQWKRHWQKHGRAKRMILSFHGLPQAMVASGDPYQKHCERTAAALRQRLQLSDQEMLLCYQSRFGSAKWLQPSTQSVIEQLAAKGIKRIDVSCPGFVVDCLETLEEVNMELREVFMKAQGECYHYLPCLNDEDFWVRRLAEGINHHLKHVLGENSSAYNPPTRSH